MFSKGEIVHLEADGGYHGLGVIMEPSRRSFDYRVYVFKYKKMLYFHSFEITRAEKSIPLMLK